MVKALHRAGIEVILDVVYNHTAEGNHLGPMLSLPRHRQRVVLPAVAREPRFYMDFTGTGNSLNPVHPSVLRLIMDSLRYFVGDCHVDGFRFDLASALAREFHEVDRLSAFFDIIHQDPILSQVKLIAEPWDVGEGGYQVGNFPVLWTEWNGIYRDVMRDFWRGAGARRRLRLPLHRLGRPLRAATGAGRRRRSTSSPRTTASRSPTSSPTTRSTTRRTSRTTATAPTTTAAGTAASRARPTTPRSTRLRERQQRNFLATLLPLAGRADAARAATRSAARRTATTTRTARTTRSRGSTGTLDERSERLLDVHAAADRAAARAPGVPALDASSRATGEVTTLPDVWWFRPDGRKMTRRDWEASGPPRSASS